MTQLAGLPKYEVKITVDGKEMTKQWYFYFSSLSALVTSGSTVTIPLAPLTVIGNKGSLTFSNGILTSYVSPT